MSSARPLPDRPSVARSGLSRFRSLARLPGATEMRALSGLAFPLILTGFAQLAISTTDLVLIGGLGWRALAAATLAIALYQLVLLFGIGLLSAVMPMLAQELGRNPHAVREVRRTVRQGLWSSVVLAVAGGVVLGQCGLIFELLGQDRALMPDAEALMRSLHWSLLPALAFTVLRGFLTALDRPLGTLVVALAAILFNAGAGYGLIYGAFGLPALGLFGAGVATSLSNLFLFAGLALLVTRARPFRRYRLFGRFWVADWARLRAFWRLGVPIAVTTILEVSVFYAAGTMMGWIGAETLAAHSIVMQIVTISYMVPMGLAQATTVRVARAVGGGDRAQVRRIALAAAVLGGACMVLAALVMLAAPQFLVGLFLDLSRPANAPILAVATALLAVAAVFQVVDAVQAIGSGVLRGLHDTLVPMLFALLGFWCVGLPFGGWLAFRAGLAGVGVWLGLAGALAAVALLMTGRWLALTRPEAR